jgi:TetR/AcrR family transcriptional regulator, cholesterol catabolism regulator
LSEGLIGLPRLSLPTRLIALSRKPAAEVSDDTPLKKGLATRAMILNAAARRFAEKGYADCSLRDIAALAGMKAGSVYYHFPSKENLLEEVIRTGSEMLTQTILAELARLGADASKTEQFQVMMRAHVTSFLDIRDDANTFLRIYNYLPPVMKQQTRRSRLDNAQIWFDAFDRGVAQGEFKAEIDRNLFIPFLLQSMNGIIEWFSPTRMTIDGICEMITAVQLDGILTEKGRANLAKPARLMRNR